MIYTFDANVNMNDLLLSEEASFPVFTPGQVVKGTVVGKSKKHILVDLGGKVTGVITGKEMNDALGSHKMIDLGQEVMAIVTKPESDEGILTLSFRKAGQLRAWERFQKSYEEQSVIDVVPSSANKGGLLVEIAGIKAFIPVSQLSPENYPRVDNANASKILEKLQTLVGRKFHVRVIGIDKEEGKLIFSEREATARRRKDAIKGLKEGDVIKGRVTGIVKFGIFVTFNDLEGLVHISEIAWGHVKNPSHYAKVGQDIDVKVIGIDGEKISLSMKQLQEDPWITAASKYKLGTVVEGVVNKVSEFGAFVTLDDDVNGLIHLSEIDYSLVTDPNDYFKEGDKVKAKVIDIDSDEHRIALSAKALKPEPKKKEEKKDKENNNKESNVDENKNGNVDENKKDKENKNKIEKNDDVKAI